MSREIMDIVHPDRFAGSGGSSADAFAHGNADAGGLALERTENQKVPLELIKSRPVDLRQFLPQQGGGVGQIGHRIGNILSQSFQLLQQQGIGNRVHNVAPFFFFAILTQIDLSRKRPFPESSCFFDFFSGYIPAAGSY